MQTAVDGDAATAQETAGAANPWARDDAARRAESLGACLGVLGLLVAVAALAALGLTRGRTDLLAESTDEPRMWASGLLTLGLLAVALQTVLLLLAYEHATVALPRRSLRGRTALGLVWVHRLVIVALVAAALVCAAPMDHAQWWTPQVGPVTWSDAGWVLLGLEAVLLLLLGQRAAQLGVWPSSKSGGSGSDGSGSGGSGSDGSGTTGGDVTPTGTADPGRPRLLAMCASGGGIRAASFFLGGHQATLAAAPDLGLPEDGEPQVFAVSGGSYLAGALALGRRYDATSTRVETPGSWTQGYVAGSVEEQRLRRHTNYLFEPMSRLRDGVVTLLLGIVVNLFLVAVGLLLLVWVSAEVTVALGLVRVNHEAAPHGLLRQGAVTGLPLTLDSWRVFWVPTAGAGLLAVLTLLQWGGAARFDDRPAGERDGRAAWCVAASARLRPLVALVVVCWLGLVALLPAAGVGLTHLAADNQPTPRVASWVVWLGLADRDVCRVAVSDHLNRAAAQATSLARLDPGTEQSVTAGACGFELTVHRTVEPGRTTTTTTTTASGTASETVVTTEVDTAQRGGSVRRLTGPERARLFDYLDQHPSGSQGQVAGIAGLLGLIGALMRRATAPRALPRGRLGPLRDRLMTWLPVTLAAGLAAYLVVLWFRVLVTRVAAFDASQRYLQVTVALIVLGCVIAFLLDANVTSMHRYYRSRLASAFAVGVTRDADGGSVTAAALEADRVYAFSQLGTDAGCPRLNVVTTLNTQRSGETPTARGGWPVVFHPGGVDVVHDAATPPRSVPISTYECFAGPGRVSVMATIGISGAAVSPLMGRFDEQMAPFRLLMTLFNLRLGVWTRNPVHTPDLGDSDAADDRLRRRSWPGVLWVTEKPGLMQMVLEGVGRSSATRRWVYLSDGGHLDNTGLVEAVRRFRADRGRILVLDASNDPVDSWAAVGDAIAVLRADLDLDLRLEPWTERERGPVWARRYVATTPAGRLEVLVVKAVRVAPPGAGEHDPCWDQLSPDLHAFIRGHPTFPRAPTTRQKFGDLEFEAYRELGRLATREALRAAAWTPSPQPPTRPRVDFLAARRRPPA